MPTGKPKGRTKTKKRYSSLGGESGVRVTVKNPNKGGGKQKDKYKKRTSTYKSATGASSTRKLPKIKMKTKLPRRR